MDYKLKNRAYTFVELMIAMALFLLIFIIIYNLYLSGMRTYQIASWKQDRSKSLQYLLKHLKEDLAEASPKVELSAGVPTITDSPLKFNSSGVGTKVIEFNRHHFNDLSALDYIIECKLELDNNVLKYTRTKHPSSPNTPPAFTVQPSTITVDDVDSVEIDVGSIVFSKSTGYEYLLEGAIDHLDEESCGSLLNLSFILVPPSTIKIKSPLIETFKRRLYVESQAF